MLILQAIKEDKDYAIELLKTEKNNKLRKKILHALNRWHRAFFLNNLPVVGSYLTAHEFNWAEKEIQSIYVD